MRTLDSALTTEQQKSSRVPAVKIAIESGETSYTLEEDRILSLTHTEDAWSVKAEVTFNNADGYFTSLNLRGYDAVIFWGMNTPSGKLYSYTSPLKVSWQQLNSAPGSLTCQLTMIGLPELLALDTASYDYLPDETSTKTVKDLIDMLFGGTMAGFAHCEEVTVDYDGSAASYLAYKPKASFYSHTGDSRLSVLKKLLGWTKCVVRWGDDGHVHILYPTVSGTSYDAEYSLSSGHAFFSKAYRKSLVLPSKVTVQSPVYTYGDSPEHTGSATDTDSYTLLPKEQFISASVEDDAEATSIAQAIMFRYQLSEQQGAATVPMDCGAEVFDYIKVTDERENDYRTGNIGSLTRTFNPLQKVYTIDFNMGDPPRYKNIKYAGGGGSDDSVSRYRSLSCIVMPVAGSLDTAGTDKSVQLLVPWKMTCWVVYVSAKTEPTEQAVHIDVNLDGTSIFDGDKPSILVGHTTDSVSFAAGKTLEVNSILTIDIDQGDEGGDAADLIVELRCTSPLWRPG
jgi:hypothetical protein